MGALDFIPWRFRSRHNFVKAHANHFLRHVLTTPPLRCDPDASVEAHLLVCHRDLHMALLAMKSFLHHVPAVALVVHDDGSLSDADAALVCSHVRGARVIRRAEADARVEPLLTDPVREIRRKHVLTMKVFDFIHYNAGRRTMLLDSDLLFLRRPDEALDWIAGDDAFVIYNPDPLRDTYRAAVRPPAPVPDWFNSGFVAYRHPLFLEQAIKAVETTGYGLEDQTIYGYLLAGLQSRALDSERYAVYQGLPPPAQACMLHFISTHRFSDQTYLDKAREVAKRLRAS
jgi:hypothetical protein